MNYCRLLFLSVLFVPVAAEAQDCKCLTMQLLPKDSANRVAVRIKNNCNRRMWFYTKGFWVRQVSEAGNAETSVLKKMENGLPEFIQFKWKEEKRLTFGVGTAGDGKSKVKVSYANTEHKYPSRFLGAGTFMCDTEVKNESAASK